MTRGAWALLVFVFFAATWLIVASADMRQPPLTPETLTYAD